MSKNRATKLMPGGIPRYVRVYDNAESIDRYTVVYSGRYRRRGEQFLYVGMSAEPTDSQGFCQHGESETQVDAPNGWPPQVGKKNHLGTRITFQDLPQKCQEIVLLEYMEIWQI